METKVQCSKISAIQYSRNINEYALYHIYIRESNIEKLITNNGIVFTYVIYSDTVRHKSEEGFRNTELRIF